MLLVSVVWLSWIPLQLYLASRRPQPPEKPADEAVVQADAGEKRPQEDQPTKENEKPAEATRAESPDATVRAAPVVPAIARQWFTLGSADPQSGYSGVYYFDNHGAAVECVELNGRYRSVEDYTGYLGRLNLTTHADGGAEVNVVGAGTPAALAKSTGAASPGLMVGDVIQSIDSVPVDAELEVANYLRKTRPGQSIALTVKRKGVAQPLQFTAQLTRRPLEVVNREWKGQPAEDIEDLHDPLSLLLTMESIGPGSARIKEDQEKRFEPPAE